MRMTMRIVGDFAGSRGDIYVFFSRPSECEVAVANGRTIE
jgi:hypothetical protein